MTINSALNSELRNGPFRATMFNSGCEVWVYDDSFLEKLKAARFWIYEINEEILQKQVTKGLIVPFSLEGDEGIEIDVYTGEPLNAEEMAKNRFLPAQEAFIKVPSGKLCIESNDTCRLSNAPEGFEEAEPEAEPDRDDEEYDFGAIIDIPSGDYLLSLYRLNWAAMRKEGLTNDYQGPSEVIILTPGERAKPFENPPAFLPFPD